MADLTDGTLEIEGGYRNRLEISITGDIGADEITTLLMGLPEDNKRHVLSELAGDPDLVGELFEKMDDDEQVDVASDHLDLDQINQVLQKLSDGDRMELFEEFCCHCGKYVGSGRCNCMRDD